MKKIILTFLAAALCIVANAKLEVRQPCSDGMVLQQKADAVVWGFADAGAKVSVKPSWGKTTYTATAGADSIWRVSVATPAASYKSYKISVKSGKENLEINDVLVGEVWFAGGQSNMEMPIKGFFNCPVENANEVITNTFLKNKVRMFTVPLKRSFEPLNSVEGEWKDAEPGTVRDMSATAFFFARQLSRTLDVPIGIVSCSYGGTKVESWMPKEVIDELYPDIKTDKASVEALPRSYHSPYMMYNAMFLPVAGYTVKGFIWYQGCSNVYNHKAYADRLAKMVSIWRSFWNDTDSKLPFYQVELAPYAHHGKKGAFLRQQQHDATKLIPNCSIIVTNDLVKPHETRQIHPCMKAPVGERLAYLALHRDYGYESLPCYSPEALSIRVDPKDRSMLLVKLSNAQDGLDHFEGVEGLEIAGADGVYYPVTSINYFHPDRELRVTHPSVPEPVSVRYCWGDFVIGNLHNCEGLPVAPFKIDLE